MASDVTKWKYFNFRIFVILYKNTKTNDFFLQNCKEKEMEIFAFCVITFEPIKI